MFVTTSLRSSHRALCVVALATLSSLSSHAAEDAPVSLPDFTVLSGQVANQEPAGTMPMPVSVLRFEPRVDIQARNMAEAQADVAIRGGIFENSGFKLGAVSLYDPQTGHYFAEIPVAPAMLQAPVVLTGSRNAIASFNADVGTISYGWRPIETRGEVTVAGGEYGYNRQSFYAGAALPQEFNGLRLAADVEWARSESDGTIPYGDHNFDRVGGRIQLRSAHTQTDFFGGYQAKFFGWPNLYTPFGFNETENLQTVLLSANHRWWDDSGNQFEVGACYRRNKDDYEFNRAVPGASNPFQHTTWVRGAALNGRAQFPEFALAYSAQYMADDITSTSLTFGPYNSRNYTKLAVVPEKSWNVTDGAVLVRAGGSYDNSDHADSALSPIAGVEWTRRSGQKIHFEYSEATQLPTYTALKSSPTSGLFRGNQNLRRETSRNLELGWAGRAGGWNLESAIFYRWDDNLVDWTYRTGVVARTANAVDIGTAGFELVASRRTRQYDVVFGYTYLNKNADYGSATIDASFYALNFPDHRLTAALTWRFGGGWEIRSDNEFRVQEENSLRTIGGDTAVLSSLGLYYLPPQLRGLEFSVLVDNLWDSDFQEVPSVPAGRRQLAAGIAWRW
ncbi:MAG TPA: TonB-dependent receptor [Candidatus Didemnitutus sp.]|nr:TonB-dependent receptor [Candidatus Didemnitutus sp.]